MNLDAIYHLGLKLYRAPELSVPMRDALEELGITWSQWLEQSGNLARLAECMVLASNGAASNLPDAIEHFVWLDRLGVPLGGNAEDTLPRYVALAPVFGVPPLQVEVREEEMEVTDHGQDLNRVLVWRPPSVALALETLRASLPGGPVPFVFSPAEQALASLTSNAAALERIESAFHTHHAEALAYRLRLGDWESVFHFTHQ